MAVEIKNNGSLKQVNINQKKKCGNEFIGARYTEIKVDEKLQYEYQVWLMPIGILILFHKHQFSIEFNILKTVGFSFSIHRISNV